MKKALKTIKGLLGIILIMGAVACDNPNESDGTGSSGNYRREDGDIMEGGGTTTTREDDLENKREFMESKDTTVSGSTTSGAR